MDWNCTYTDERLGEYVDGLLTPEEAKSLTAHAGGCERCGEMVGSVSALVTRMRALEPVAEPPQLVRKILNATAGPRSAEKGWRRLFAWAPPAWPRFAMGAVTVAITLVVVLHTAGLAPKRLRKANLDPADALRSANRQVHLVYARSAKFVNDLRVVYEIQSRLQPEPTPQALPEEQPEPPARNPQEKSQTGPNRGRSQIRNNTMYAGIWRLEAGS
ncbi:MAG: anti-sigma factor family protein [Candidatus Acidiferrales bacterium]